MVLALPEFRFSKQNTPRKYSPEVRIHPASRIDGERLCRGAGAGPASPNAVPASRLTCPPRYHTPPMLALASWHQWRRGTTRLDATPLPRRRRPSPPPPPRNATALLAARHLHSSVGVGHSLGHSGSAPSPQRQPGRPAASPLLHLLRFVRFRSYCSHRAARVRTAARSVAHHDNLARESSLAGLAAPVILDQLRGHHHHHNPACRRGRTPPSAPCACEPKCQTARNYEVIMAPAAACPTPVAVAARCGAPAAGKEQHARASGLALRVPFTAWPLLREGVSARIYGGGWGAGPRRSGALFFGSGAAELAAKGHHEAAPMHRRERPPTQRARPGTGRPRQVALFGHSTGVVGFSCQQRPSRRGVRPSCYCYCVVRP